MSLSESEYMLLVVWVEVVTPTVPVCVAASDDVVLLVMVATCSSTPVPQPMPDTLCSSILSDDQLCRKSFVCNNN